ncbi:MAG: RNA-directed DNA polymerase [Bacilli bacterium]|nr:RNA-directed DNA polymerase [Bacilli bacterium]
MKRLDNLYKEACKLDNIIEMTNKVCTRVRNKNKVNKFENYKMEHIYSIYKRLNERNLNVGKYNIFMITDPKCRIVMAQEIEDKIINHLIADYVLVKAFDNKYGSSMCATRIGKGTLYGAKLLKKYLNEIKRKYDNFYVLKIYISKYFYKIDHEILKNILRKKIKDKDSLNILDSIIDSTNKKYVNEEIIKLKNSRISYLMKSNLKNKDELIKEVEEIPLYEKGFGVALGNQTSQAFGLIFLYEINHFIKEKLHIKYLINYMDDFVIIHHDKQYLNYSLNEIKEKIEKEYNLKINFKKTRIDNIKNGIDFLGYKFYIKNNKVILKLKNQTKKKLKNKLKNVKLLKKHDLINEKDFYVLANSYNGVLKWGSCSNLHYQVFKE